jgi:hypothetical protein
MSIILLKCEKSYIEKIDETWDEVSEVIAPLNI